MTVDPADLARELVRRRKVERDMDDRRAARLRSVVGVEAAAIVGNLQARRAWLIGSLAWGEFGEHIDVDLVFSEVDRALLLQVEIEVARATGAPVDVLELHQLPSSFRDRIVQTGLKLV